jgi:hypothetical protein
MRSLAGSVAFRRPCALVGESGARSKSKYAQPNLFFNDIGLGDYLLVQRSLRAIAR